jgi:muconolactone delta-isomerase
MKVLALEKELNLNLSNPDLMAGESRRIYELYKQNKIREIYFAQPQHTAVIIFEVDDIAEARNLISSFPLVKNQVIDFDLMELKPYNGFDRLIQESQ